MPFKFFTHILKKTLQGKFLSLLICVLVYLTLIPMIIQFIELRFLTDIFVSLILVAAISAASEKKSEAVIALALGVPMLAALWINLFFPQHWLQIGVHLLIALFFGYAIVRLLAAIFTAPRVTRDVIYAAIIVYLLMGLLWTDLYLLLNVLEPGSFAVANIRTDHPNLIMLYFSFVTLTTLGYGDITPLTDIGYSLAILEAIMGQLYLAVLVARLVGLHIARPENDDR